ncbi:MAG: cytochrome c oxidase subunit I [Solirubrobacteraceae bacterium]
MQALPIGGASLRTLASTDHKRIAAHACAVALGFFVAGGILALIMRSQLAADGGVVSQNVYNQMFTIHGSTMIMLFMVPIGLAAGIYLVPLQVGAAEIAAPRLALAGLWLLVLGGATMWAGWLTSSGAASASWWGFDPLSNSIHSPGSGMEFWIFGALEATLGQILWAICIILTALRKRAPGMTLMRMPAFTWTMVATCLLTIFAFPAFLLALWLLWAQRHFGGVLTGGLGAIDYQQLFWFYGHPVVYVMFFPFVGMVAEVISTFASRRFFGYSAFVVALLAFSGLSMTVWGHHMFTMGQLTNKYFSLTSTALLVPAGIEYFDFLGTLWSGRLRFPTAMLFALGFVVQFLIGGLTGIILASPPLNYGLNMSYFVVAHFHYTIFAGSAFGLFGGMYFWFPKMTGAMLDDRLGKINFILMTIGTNLTFFPMFALGAEGMPRRIADYPASSGWQTLNVLETVGSAILALSVAVFLANVFLSLRRRVPAGENPWAAHTLEWATSSPPPRFNFSSLPPIRSYAPLLDLREEQQEREEQEQQDREGEQERAEQRRRGHAGGPAEQGAPA